MHQDHETLNGSTALVLYKLGRIEVMAENTERRVCKIEQQLESKPRLSDRMADLLPYLTGVVVLVLALAGRWAELGQFLQR